MPLKSGDKAPALDLLDQSGNTVKLGDFKGRKVLVYFYPKADTPGCTQQSCGMRDILGQIGDTAVLGISPDKPAKYTPMLKSLKFGMAVWSHRAWLIRALPPQAREGSSRSRTWRPSPSPDSSRRTSRLPGWVWRPRLPRVRSR